MGITLINVMNTQWRLIAGINISVMRLERVIAQPLKPCVRCPKCLHAVLPPYHLAPYNGIYYAIMYGRDRVLQPWPFDPCRRVAAELYGRACHQTLTR